MENEIRDVPFFFPETEDAICKMDEADVFPGFDGLKEPVEIINLEHFEDYAIFVP